MQIARRHDPVELREAQSEDEAKRIWLGRKSAFGAMGQINDYMCLDGTIPVSSCRRCCAGSARCRRNTGWRSPTCSTRATATCTR
jgi:glycolate oxidase